MPKISIIIIHWNTPRVLNKQLNVLKKTDQNQIIIIDNNSQKTLEKIKDEFNNILWIENDFNYGFASAANQGVVKAESEWLFFLNPDTHINNNEVKQMLKFAKDKDLDALSIKSQDFNYEKAVPTPLSLLSEFTSLKYIVPQKIFKNKTLVGGCLLIKKKVLLNLGGWDERFFLWFEDSDLTKRLIAKNYKTGFYPGKIKHLGASSFKKMPDKLKKDIFFYSMQIYAQKHFPFLGQKIVELIKSKYSKRKVLPLLNQGINIVVPNLKISLLKKFLQKNPINQASNKLIIVSSALNNSSIWEFRQKFPHISFIPILKNKGFAHTVNIGLAKSTTKWMGTINDDVIFPKNWTEKILICANNQTGSINPIIKNSQNIIESAGINISKKGKANPIKKLENKNKCFQTKATNAAAVLYANKALNQVGLFDERFGSYLEDIDLSLRLKKQGWQNIVSAESELIHRGQASSNTYLKKKKNWLDFKNWILIIIKHWKLKTILKNFPLIFLERLKNFSAIFK